VGSDATTADLMCGTASRCDIYYKKAYTPVIYYINPPVVYFDSIVDIWFNPKSIMGLIVDLLSDEMPFINTKIGNALVNFEDFVGFETTFSGMARNRVRGRVTDQPIADSQNVTMQWETGKATTQL